MTERRTTAISALGLAAVLTPAALLPIGSYDFFWHLATGRWIVEHRGLPGFDPFAVASDHVAWINGEWLFQVALHAIGSVTAIAWMRAAAVAVLFAAVYFFAARQAGRPVALLLAAAAFAGGVDRLDARPSTAAAVLLAAGLVLLDLDDLRGDLAFVALSALWINVHPSALLAPAIALAARRIHWLPAASAAALLVNPFGYRAIAAPLELMRFAGSGAFVNAEWLPSPIVLFPMLYVLAVAGLVLFALVRRDAWRFVVFAGLAWLAIAHVRNQGLFFAAAPLLLAPFCGAVGVPRRRTVRLLASGIAAILVMATLLRGVHRPGLAPGRFPVAAVARLRASGLRGNIYNPDQFGGFLIWSFYPERRVLTDGRNELYRTFIREYAAARLDSRAWHALLAKYSIDLSVDEYRPPLDTVNPRNGQHRAMPASLAYWPRREWALVGYDDVGMVFARRAAFTPAQIDSLEIRGVVPDAAR